MIASNQPPPVETEIPEEVRRIAKVWSKKRGALIMALHQIQNLYGYVPRDVALQMAGLMDVPMARIYEVITFYNYFKLTPPGKFTVSICMGTACYLKGADELMAAFAKELGIGENESTEDGMFHLQSVRCVGCCGLAPVVVVNGQTHAKVGVADVPKIIAACRAAEEA